MILVHKITSKRAIYFILLYAHRSQEFHRLLKLRLRAKVLLLQSSTYYHHLSLLIHPQILTHWEQLLQLCSFHCLFWYLSFALISHDWQKYLSRSNLTFHRLARHTFLFQSTRQYWSCARLIRQEWPGTRWSSCEPTPAKHQTASLRTSHHLAYPWQKPHFAMNRALVRKSLVLDDGCRPISAILYLWVAQFSVVALRIAFTSAPEIWFRSF